MKEAASVGKMLQKLPEGIQNFGQIIAENRLYADKTPFIYNMLTELDSKYVFLFRPGGFGKTLLLDTLQELFLGRKELFENLWIARETDYDFQPYQVLRLSMNYAETDSSEQLEANIIRDLLAAAKSMGVTITETSCGRILKQLLEGLNKDGAGTAVLIDDYDAPVFRHFDSPKLAAANCQVLHNLLTALKDSEKLLRFVLVTGLAGFQLKSDSGPANFDDLSLQPEFGGVCGFTVSEFDGLFGDRMDDLLKVQIKNGCLPPSSRTADLREQILDWYGGYYWLSPEQVLNPLAIVNLFSKKKFKSSWIQNDPPDRLKELIQSRPLVFLDPQMVSCLSCKIGKVDLDRLDPRLVLFYSGYLTIEQVIITSMTPGIGHRCTFKYPNKEAEDGFSSLIDDSFGQNTWQGLKNLAPAFLKAADRRDSAVIAGLFTNLLPGLTSFQSEAGRYFYHALIQSCLAFGWAKVYPGRFGALGRSDIIVERPGERYLIIEVKYRKSQAHHTEADIKKILAESSEEALKQIVKRDYAGPFRRLAKEILGLSLAVYGRKDVRSDFVTQNLLKDAKWSGQKVRPD